MTYISLSSESRGLILVVCTLVVFLNIYNYLRIRMLGRSLKERLLPGTVMFLAFVLMQILSMQQQGDLDPSLPVPLILILPAMGLMLIYGLFLQVKVRRPPRLWKSLSINIFLPGIYCGRN